MERAEDEDGWSRVERRRNHFRGPITTLFFTHFPEDFSEKNMWGVFAKWGKVVDIFIPGKRNKEGRRFGFVRMVGVDDPAGLARRMDQTFIGNMKLFVNVPRFEKGASRSQKMDERHYDVRMHLNHRRTDESRYTTNKILPTTQRLHGKERGGNGSYKQKLLHGTSSEKKITQHEEEIETAGETQLEGLIEKWMEKSLIGRLKSPDFLEGAQDTFVLAGMHSVRIRHLGGMLVLLTGDEGVDLMNVVKDSGDEWKEIFEDVAPWSPSMSIDSRLLWVKCEGLPLQFWNTKSFASLVNPVGELVAIDDETLSFSRLSFARLRIRTTTLDPVVLKTKILVDGNLMFIRLVEELGQCEAKRQSSYEEEEDDTSDWSQFEAKVPQSEMGFSSGGEEEEVDGVIGEKVEQGAPVGILNALLGATRDEGPDDRKLKIHDEYRRSTNLGGQLDNDKQLIKLTCQENDSQTHVSNSNGLGSADFTEAHTLVNQNPIYRPSSPPKSNPDLLDPQSRELEGVVLHFGTIVTNREEEKKDLNSEGRNSEGIPLKWPTDAEFSQAASMNSTTQLNSKGLAVVLRRSPGLGLISTLKGLGGVDHSNEAQSSWSCPDFRSQERQNEYSTCSSISDSRIELCNKRYWTRNSAEEAEKIWGLGKLLGVSFSGDNRDMVNRLSEMEDRDSEEFSNVTRKEGGGVQSVNQ